MDVKQIIRIHTTESVEDVNADRVLIENDEYVLCLENQEVMRIPISDVVINVDPDTGEMVGEIETIYSRS